LRRKRRKLDKNKSNFSLDMAVKISIKKISMDVCREKKNMDVSSLNYQEL